MHCGNRFTPNDICTCTGRHRLKFVATLVLKYKKKVQQQINLVSLHRNNPYQFYNKITDKKKDNGEGKIRPQQIGEIWE